MSLKHKISIACYQFSLLRWIIYPFITLRREFLRRWVPTVQLDNAVENLFVEAPLISVPEFEGEFRIGTKSDLLHRLLRCGRYEPELATLARLLIDPQRDVIDVGANVGFFTVLAAQHTTARVFAVEPVSQILMLLRQNIEHNGVASKVNIFEGVISDASGFVSMHVVDGYEEYSSTAELAHPSVEGKLVTDICVTASTLDDLVTKNDLNPGLVKIDVEGGEHRVLLGSRNTLLHSRPIIISEFSPKLLIANGVDPANIIKILREARYRIADPLYPELTLGRRALGDLLAVPEEKFSMQQLRCLLNFTLGQKRQAAVERENSGRE